MERFDVLVLGAGIVGVSAAWHLLRRGRTVAVLDRRGPGEETSFGNAGVVERDGFLPMHFPESLSELLRVAGNQQPQVHYHLAALPGLTPTSLLPDEAAHAGISFEALIDRLLHFALDRADARVA